VRGHARCAGNPRVIWIRTKGGQQSESVAVMPAISEGEQEGDEARGEGGEGIV